MPSKWTKFCLQGSFWCHFPILQPFVHLTYLKELRNLDIEIQENLKQSDDIKALQKMIAAQNSMINQLTKQISYN